MRGMAVYLQIAPACSFLCNDGGAYGAAVGSSPPEGILPTVVAAGGNPDPWRFSCASRSRGQTPTELKQCSTFPCKTWLSSRVARVETQSQQTTAPLSRYANPDPSTSKPNAIFLLQGREASKQSHVSTMIQGSVLDRTSLEDAVSCDVASKIATTFLSPTEVGSSLSGCS